MEQTNTGIRGAKVQSWNAANPRDLLKTVIDENPGSDRHAIFSLFRARLVEHDDGGLLMQTIVEYWLANNFYALVGDHTKRRNARGPREEISRHAAAIGARVKEKIREEAQVLLLEMVLPNGKPLGDCTGLECREMAPRIGRWLGEVGRRVRGKKIVRVVLTEREIRELY